MNAYATENDPYDFGGSGMSPSAPSPRGKRLVEGYRKDILSGFEKDPPLFNPVRVTKHVTLRCRATALTRQQMNKERPQSSALVDLKDPIQVHLLTETALTDSKHYEILSQEEVDDLKKRCQSLSQRVESTRANLTIQSKYRDAAISMAKLYAPGRTEGRRRSLLSRHSGDQESAREAELERQASERKCEELAAELFNLEKRLMEPQRRLLEHTAGILQLTHKASNKRKNMPLAAPAHLINGMPGSPESLYTYSRNSIDAAGEGHYLEDAGMDHFEQLDGMRLQTKGLPRANPIEIPLKSPIREQHQLREEMDRVRDENTQLRHQTDALVNSISEMERRFEDLNVSLRDAIVRFDPAKNNEFSDPPARTGNAAKIGDTLRTQMDYLEMGLFAIQAEQESMGGGDKEIERRIESLNRHIQDILSTVNPAHPPPPQSDDSRAQMDYLEDSLRAVESELARAREGADLDPSLKQDGDQIEAVLMGLWDIIQSGFANIKQQNDDRRRARQEKGLKMEEEDMSGDEDFDTEEKYTLTGFSERVKWLYSQATTLKDQKSVLKRQIKQQRLLNNKSDAEKDEEIQRKQEELEESRALIDRAEKDAMDAQMLLSEALEDLEKAREAAASGNSARADIEERDGHIETLETEVKQLRANLDAAENEIKQLQANAEVAESQIKQLESNYEVSESQVKQLQANSEAAQSQMKQLQSDAEASESQVKQLQASSAAAEAQVKQLEANLAAVENGSKGSEGKLAEVEATIVTLSKQLDEVNRSKSAAEESATSLKDQVEAQKDALTTKEKALKQKEDELDELNMNMVEMKTELTIAQAELDGAYGTRAERAAEVAAIKTSAEVVKLQNQIERLKKELRATATELEDVTRETLGAEREKIELETKLDDAQTTRIELETEISALRERLETDVQKSREKMAKLQEELDSERLKAIPSPGRVGAGASMLSEQFRATMREERKKFQEDIKVCCQRTLRHFY